MNREKLVKFINFIILVGALIAIIVLLLGRAYFEAINMVPIVLITSYTLLDGFKFVLTGRKRTGYALIFFAVIMAVMIVTLKMKLF